MKYNFDEVIDRSGTGSIKHDFKKEYQIPEDALSLWVADMDFQAAPEIQEMLQKRVAHGVYGYTNTTDEFADIVCGWFERNFGYRFEGDWLVKTPGVVFALSMAVRAFTEPGDAILIQQPVYYPFARGIKNNDRVLVDSPLIYDKENAYYTVDFVDFEKKIVENQVKMFILCSPHNPVGRVWKKEELEKMDAICRKHGVFVVSDEIHCDFVWGENKHTIFSSLSEDTAANCMVCTAPSKTFNLAGLQYSSIFIPNVEKRELFIKEIEKTGYDEPTVFGIIGATAAYSKGEEWLRELKAYVYENIKFMDAFLKEKMPQVKMIETQGTYLTWVDCSALGYSDEELNKKIVEAGVWLDPGNFFGKPGEQFERFNLACPRSILAQALERFATILP